MDNEDNQGVNERILNRQFKNDAHIFITVSEDEFTARADFFPPVEDGLPLTPELVQSEIDASKLSYGVEWESIQDAMVACNLDRKVQRDVVIAKGIVPHEEVPEHLVLEDEYAAPRQLPDETKPAAIDYHTFSPFIMVNKDAVLGRQIGAEQGSLGTTVYGKERQAGKKPLEQLHPGKNTELKGDSLLALASGRLLVVNGEVSIEEVLQIKSGVDFHTGNIDFPGDIYIDGAIQEGFRISAGGSVWCKTTMDATEISVKKDLIATSGIIGRMEGTVKVGGNLSARFLQNCKVACRSAIRISGDILNSEVYTLDSIFLGDKSRVVGGELYAVHRVSTCSLGSASGKLTTLRLGTDFTVQQQLNATNARLHLLSLRIRKINAEMKENPSARLATLREQMGTKIKDYSIHLSDLLGRLDIDEDAVLEATGDVHPGTFIEICHIAFDVQKPLKRVRFKLDKEKGRVIYENL